MCATRYPTEAQEKKVAEMASDLSRAYRQFRAPRSRKRRRRPADTTLRLRAAAAPIPHANLAQEVASFDWRDRIQIRPPGNQGLCYACTSFALAATIEARWLIAHPESPLQVSAGFIHTCIGHADDVDPNTICNVGCDMYATLTLLLTNEYARSTPADYPFETQACATALRLGVVSSFSEIVEANGAKSSIVNSGPIAADLYIWKDFFSYTTKRGPVYVPDTSTAGPYLHSVCVVGYNASGWIIKNSLGTSWGDGSGFATVAFGACGMIGGQAPPNKVARKAFAITL